MSVNGFTLIELMCAIAILFIVAASILRMFVVSARLDKSAEDNDTANLKVTTLAEQFKADPSSFYKRYADGFTQYYDYGWNETEAENAVFKIEANVTKSKVEDSEGVYYPPSNISSRDGLLLNTAYSGYYVVLDEYHDRVRDIRMYRVDIDARSGSDWNDLFEEEIYPGFVYNKKFNMVFKYPSDGSENIKIYVSNRTSSPELAARLCIYVVGDGDNRAEIIPEGGEISKTLIDVSKYSNYLYTMEIKASQISGSMWEDMMELNIRSYFNR